MNKLELVSFDLCPFVQRSVITLKHKKVKFELTYIDLENPPQWFEKISPMGKVPVLKVDEKTVLFESAVINEYLDETTKPQLHSNDPLTRAFERAWTEYGSELLGANYHLSMETNPDQIEGAQKEFMVDLARVEEVISASGPYFRGKDLSLVDFAYAPLFMRIQLSPRLRDDQAWKQMPKVSRWSKALLDLPAVRESVIPNFAEKYVAFCKDAGSLIF